MSAFVKYFVVGLITAGTAGFLGYGLGINEGYQQHERLQRSLGMDQLRALLKENEQQHIFDLVRVSADIDKKDEGGLFSTRWVHYLNCKVLNAASVATVKDVRLRLDFFSKTDALVDSEEINVYEFIQPNREFKYRQKVKWPSEADKFSITVIDAGYDNR